MKLLETSDDFKTFLKESKTLVAMFSADWCGPCKVLSPEFGNLKAEDTEFLKVDVTVFDDLFDEYKITTLPTFIIFENGIEEKRENGSSGFSNISKLYS